ncbi:MAG: hypothetical protein N2378_10060 [Chloroflexaceae bacterium]|nr:hypothetical protein [Chloroflexaceae bacterium]
MSKRRPGAPADLEEVRPDLFVVHNPAAGPVLRGDGLREGDRFRLTTWRREGLIARLRNRGFDVLTLADQIAALPPLPLVAPPGEPFTWQFAPGERISYFAADPPGWHEAPNLAPDRVSLREGWVIRRRKGRGPADYYRAGRGTLTVVDETTALHLGYALIAQQGGAALSADRAGEGWRLPDVPLPPEHRRLFGRFATHTRDGWLIPAAALPLATALLARLGLHLRAA